MTASNFSDPPSAPACDPPAASGLSLDTAFRKVAETSASSIVVTDAAGRILYVNPACERTTGYTLAELRGKNPRIFNARTQPAKVYEEIWQTITAGREWTGLMHNRRKDGSLYWEQATISPLPASETSPARYVGVKEDISRLREAEAQNRWLGTLVQHTPEICAVRDLHGRLLAVNDAYIRFSGLPDRASILGRTDLEVLRKVGVSAQSTCWMRFAEGLAIASTLPPGQSHTIENTREKGPGAPQVHTVTFLPIYGPSGELVATAAIAQDVTAERAREQALQVALQQAEEASRTKSVFLGTVSHELRTPLNAIIGVSATLAEEAHLGPDIRRSVEWIQHSGELLLAQIEGLLQYARLEAGEARIERQVFDLLPCLGEGLRFHLEGARKRGLALTYAFDPNLPARVRGDAEKLRRILDNLLSNAVKFTDRGSVHLVASRQRAHGGDRLALEVTDTGIGIAEDVIERIFLPFYQVDGSDTRRHGGSGLGLAIAKSLVKALGGTLEVQSRPGEGSTFRLTLPLHADGHGHLYEPLQIEALRGQTVRLLVPQDEERRLLEAFFAASGANLEYLTVEDLEPTERAVCPAAITVVDYRPLEALPARILVALERTKRPLLWLHHERPDGIDPLHSKHYHLSAGILPDQLHRACLAVLLPSVSSFSPAPSEPKLGEAIPLRVLVVDDVESNRQVVQLMLRQLGYEADLASDGKAAVARATTGDPYDLIFMDLQMPGMDGLEATRRIRRGSTSGAGTRIVALTANVEQGVETRCRQAGMDAYLSKPVTPQAIARCLRRLGTRPAPSPEASLTFFPLPPGRDTRLLDRAHLESLSTDLGQDGARQILGPCLESFEKEYAQSLPALREALDARDTEECMRLVHGLKGGAAMLGLGRFRDTAQAALEALRADTFTHWESLADELDELAGGSIDALRQYFHPASADDIAPASS
ncbi:MAG: ATP-binding protein [Verrucomicrobiota bacterium]